MTLIMKCKFLLFMLILNIYNNVDLVNGFGMRCDRTPEGSTAHKSPPDGRFRLRIAGNPEHYTPGESYNVTLGGIRSMQIPHKFAGFFLAAEKDLSDLRDYSMNQINRARYDVGTFHLYDDALAKFSEKCPNVVTHTSSMPKTEIVVSWTAPPPGSGCIVFRSTVIEHRDVWYMDDGFLSKSFCEDEADSIDREPSILSTCCACDEAKYELTFEGLWSRHTHPKDFPSNNWLTKFSDVIGASHTVDYRFWEYGQIASKGLKEVAEHGSTRTLETELKSQSDHIRTIIKARGISYPNVTGKTFAVFRVDSKHHLVSLVSMINPSPDWIVGVSGMELCRPNCTWIENKVLNLYPWDAGTDSGPTYISPDQPTIPQEAIRRIRPNFPNNPKSPFYDPEGKEMKPFARLYLSRQRLYEKSCDNNGDGSNNEACATTEWGPYSECNTQCGKGKKSRQRSYIDSNAAEQAGCRVKLTQRKECFGEQQDCDDEMMIDQPEAPDPECAVTEWSEFSECSTQCGKGSKTRTRQFRNRRVDKKCRRRPNAPLLEETIECHGDNCSGDITNPLVKAINPKCKLSDWSNWSPCTVTCGMGVKVRSRHPLLPNFDMRQHHRKVTNYYNYRAKNRNRNSIDDEDEDDEDEEVEEYIDNRLGYGVNPNDPCNNVPMVEEVVCGHSNPPCESDIYGVPEFCLLDPKPGSCRVPDNRWYFDKNLQDCAVFVYTGCNGNNNNFQSREDCLASCKIGNFANLQVLDQRQKIDCEVTHWKRGACNVTCGDGYRVKSRTIVKHPQNGGRSCPRKLSRFEKCHVSCNNQGYDKFNSWAAMPQRAEQIECRYGAWSNWSPCSKTCGDFAVQQRTRAILNQAHSPYCTDRLEERKCDIMPCLIGYHRRS